MMKKIMCQAIEQRLFTIYREELKTREEAYKKRTGQKLQKNSITHLSAHHTEQDLKKVCDYLEETLDTKIFTQNILK